MTAMDALPEIVRRLVEAARPQRIILFGSWAKGTNRPESDLDLLVIEDEPFGPQRSRLREIGRLERAIGRLPYSTDILVYSRDEVQRWQSSSGHVIARALQEGTEVYVRQ
ncbi:nucleotidyltransferase domain-containing protein [Geoalkalibacter sp.]|jgi:predicted nucleotidyltransferase|uniref:nucleotidyltransferase domain-containing protein n=1 Tax=Geoalkalibacter sp. TaxID=3041440 RepID=UPI00272E5FDE|nr:nucleotidyltransferase domain-containing protein [Geoalkalibacter sp.]